ncbi:MAG: AAA family ATPase [Methylococcaceae bacterium]
MLPDDTNGIIIDESNSLPELIFDDGDKLADNAAAPEYVVNDFLETDAHGIINGASMSFKTFWALRLAFSVCTGRDFFGHQVFNIGRVLYVCGEGKGAISRRIKALKITEGPFNGNLMRLNSPLRIDNIEDMRRLSVMIDKVKPALVIFDTFASLISVTEESSPSDVGRVLRLIKDTCRNGQTSSLIIHHFGKDGNKGARGASNFLNDPDFSLKLARIPETMLTELSCEKMKDGDHFAPVLMRAHVVELGLIRQDGTMTTSLVLKPTDEIHQEKARKTKMTANETNILAVLSEVIETDGIKPNDEIKYKFKQYFSQTEKNPKIAEFAQLKTAALDRMTTKTDNKHTKQTAFDRASKSLISQGVIVHYGGFVWRIFDD